MTDYIASPQPHDSPGEPVQSVNRLEFEVLTRRVEELHEAITALTLELEHVRHRLDTLEHQLRMRE
jgi:hypothetical protein